MFEKFNLIQYSLTHDGKKLTDYILTDITTRARLKASDDVLMTFDLREGESPEDVSQTMYGTPYYHWVIMMLNNVFDVYTDWFMGDEQLHAFAVAKYNISYAITPANISVANNTFTKTAHEFKPNDIVTVSSRVLPGGLSANTNYYVFNTTDNTFQLTTNIHDTSPIDITSVGTYNVTVSCNKLDVPSYWADEQDNIISSALDLYEGWSNNEDTRISYQNQMNLIISGQASRYSYQPASNKTVTEVDTDVLEIVEGVTPAVDIEQMNVRALTNFEYEALMNKTKKTIFVLRPEYIKTFVDQFNKAVKA